MKSTLPSPYTIPEVELPYIIHWLAYQSRIGSGITVTENSLFYYFGPFKAVVWGVNRIDNPIFEEIITQFISTSIGTDKALEWTKMSLVCEYYYFLKNTSINIPPAGAVKTEGYAYSFPWVSHFNTFCSGFAYKWLPSGSSEYSRYVLDSSSGKVYEDIVIKMAATETITTPGNKKISDQWGYCYMESLYTWTNIPATYIAMGEDINKKAEVENSQKSLINTLNGTFKYPAKGIQPAEGTQLANLNKMLAEENLSTEGYFLLLLLIIGLNTSGTTGKTLATKIISASSSSEGYQNDTFINQLVYLTVMHLVNPNGPYKWKSDHVSDFLTNLSALLKQTDPSSTIIKEALKAKLDVLKTNPTYPLTDPLYNETFEVRMADTLAALTVTKLTLKPTKSL